MDRQQLKGLDARMLVGSGILADSKILAERGLEIVMKAQPAFVGGGIGGQANDEQCECLRQKSEFDNISGFFHRAVSIAIYIRSETVGESFYPLLPRSSVLQA